MYKGKNNPKHTKTAAKNTRSKIFRTGRLTLMGIATAVLLVLTVGGTVAWLSSRADPIINTFNPSKVSCKVTESFDGAVISNVNVENTGDITSYVRIRLVSYRTNGAGEHIGGTAPLASFTPGENWVEYNGYYYYTLPVDSGAKPATDLIDSMTLTSAYTDADGGRQSVDVLAEAIQSSPEKAVGQAWGVSISQGTVTAYSGN